ncbi:MAG: hypothetical protein A2Y10_07265 [Planctomycetes bacterium GWF2_41_51]|nr:MAG: hypothetical protein A2Y10_07265 [Planctomycetes bacterium GWF2_41_51]HBG27885.1 hypothetical protein [Phycisphaerales bacterium]
MKKKAFTLVELLVVISIIAMLLAILMPTLSRARQGGQRIVCANHQKTIGLANQIYANSWNGSFVPLLDTSIAKPAGTKGNYTYYCWVANKSFRDYLNFDKSRTEKYNRTGSVFDETGTIMPNEFYCPADEIAKKKKVSSKGVLVSFGYNATDWQAGFEAFNWKIPTSKNNIKFAGYKVTDVKSPGNELALVDSVDWYVFWNSAEYASYWDKYGQLNPDEYADKTNGMGGITIYRHNEGANVLFYDAHVSYMNKNKIFVKQNPSFPARLTKDATGMWSAK